MLPRNHPDRIQIAFDDHGLVANAGLILPATLALRLPYWMACPNSSGSASTSAMRRAGPTPATR